MATTSPGTGQAQSFSSPQEEALLTLFRSADALERVMHQTFKPYGLTPTQYNVLRILRGAQPGGLTCSAIGHRMITPEPDITRLLSRLKAQELLCQHRDKQDRRVVWTRISASGLELLTRLDPVVEHAPKEMLRQLTGADLKSLIVLLNKISSCGSEPYPSAESPLIAQPRSPQPPLPLRPRSE